MVRRATEAASDRETNNKEDDDCSRKIETKNNDSSFMNIKLDYVISFAHGTTRDNGDGVSLVQEKGREREENGQHKRKDDE